MKLRHCTHSAHITLTQTMTACAHRGLTHVWLILDCLMCAGGVEAQPLGHLAHWGAMHPLPHLPSKQQRPWSSVHLCLLMPPQGLAPIPLGYWATICSESLASGSTAAYYDSLSFTRDCNGAMLCGMNIMQPLSCISCRNIYICISTASIMCMRTRTGPS